MEITIKPFEQLTNYEVYNMIRIREEVFILEQDCVYVDCDKNDTLCDHLLVKENNEIVATLRIVPAGIKYEQISIGRVVVTEQVRKQGLGTIIMTEALAYIKDKYGQVPVVLSAQVAIKGLYEKSGFKVISAIYIEDGIDHVKMLLDTV